MIIPLDKKVILQEENMKYAYKSSSKIFFFRIGLNRFAINCKYLKKFFLFTILQEAKDLNSTKIMSYLLPRFMLYL